MQSVAVAFFAILAMSCSGLASADEYAGKPVSKVITLLKDMVEQLEKEGKEDEEIYEAMSCWCTTNDKEKTKAIADNEAKIGILEAAIEEYAANSARLNTEIEKLTGEVAENTEALEKATAMRQKEMAEFNAEEKESLQTISSLKGAVEKLSKLHEASFLQTSESTVSQLSMMQSMASLQHKLQKHSDLVGTLITPRQRKMIKAFLQQSQGEGEAAPASGEIFGLMKQMKEGFETNLANSQKEEMTSQDDYSNLKQTKEEEIAAGNSLIETKTQELATTDEKHAQSIQDLDDTRNTLAADTKFLASLKEQCANVDVEYEARVKTRQQEIQAVSKALAFLSSDEAQDLVSRTLGFIQIKQTTEHKKRTAKVSKMLSKIAKKFQDPRISALAIQSRLDAFVKVKKSIQDMVDKLVKEKEDEIAHKDFCVEELNTNGKETQDKNQEKSTLEANIADLTEKMASLTKEVAALKAEISSLQVEIKRAGEDKIKENTAFQTTVADQRATQKLLATALEILKGFYEKASLVQMKAVSKRQPAGPPPPPGFKKQEPNAQSGGVMGMIQMIIDDAKAMEAEAIKAEEDSQKAYEAFVTEANDSITTNEKAIVHAEKAKAKAEGDKAEAEEELGSVKTELDALMDENKDLHESCDYTLKNFDVRQTARDDEIEALKQALSMLSGASFSAFLQNLPF